MERRDVTDRAAFASLSPLQRQTMRDWRCYFLDGGPKPPTDILAALQGEQSAPTRPDGSTDQPPPPHVARMQAAYIARTLMNYARRGLGLRPIPAFGERTTEAKRRQGQRTNARYQRRNGHHPKG